MLIPSFVWAGLGGTAGTKQIYPVLRRYRVVALGLVFGIGLLVGKAFLDSRYMRFNAPIFQRRGILHSVMSDIKYQTSEWGDGGERTGFQIA